MGHDELKINTSSPGVIIVLGAAFGSLAAVVLRLFGFPPLDRAITFVFCIALVALISTRLLPELEAQREKKLHEVGH